MEERGERSEWGREEEGRDGKREGRKEGGKERGREGGREREREGGRGKGEGWKGGTMVMLQVESMLIVIIHVLVNRWPSSTKTKPL